MRQYKQINILYDFIVLSQASWRIRRIVIRPSSMKFVMSVNEKFSKYSDCYARERMWVGDDESWYWMIFAFLFVHNVGPQICVFFSFHSSIYCQSLWYCSSFVTMNHAITDCPTQLTVISSKQKPSQYIRPGLRPSTVRVLNLCDSGFAIVVVDSKISSLVKSLDHWCIFEFGVTVRTIHRYIVANRRWRTLLHAHSHLSYFSRRPNILKHLKKAGKWFNFDSRTNSILFYLVPSDEMPLNSNWTNIFSMRVLPFVFTAHGNGNDNRNIWHIFSMTISVWFHLIFNNVVARTYRYLDLNNICSVHLCLVWSVSNVFFIQLKCQIVKVTFWNPFDSWRLTTECINF